MKIDLHLHSICSDGTDNGEEILRKCSEYGMDYVALTDHDTFAGTEEFIRVSKEYGIKTVSGIEFSADYPTEMHILVYGFDPANKQLKAALDNLVYARNNRIYEMLEKLQRMNFKVYREELDTIIGTGVPARPHLAQLMLNKGYVKSIKEAFDKYISKDGPAYVKRKLLSYKEILELAYQAGGIPVLAHPKLIYSDNYENLIDELQYYGLKGIEAYYPMHNDKEVEYFRNLAYSKKLLISQGSDYHGTRKPDLDIGIETRGLSDVYLFESINYIFNHKTNACD